jgi:hypothetical protein
MMFSRSRTVVRLFCALVLLSLATSASALTINPTFNDSGGLTWTDAYKGVVNQAISEWEAVILEPETINITFDFTTGNSYLGQWSGIRPDSGGYDLRPWSSNISHTIHFNADLVVDGLYHAPTDTTYYLWFDETPLTDGDQASNEWDALSVARHELGHAMGFINDFYVDNVGTGNAINWWGDQIDSNNVFDPDGLAIPMNGTDWAHVAESGLMAQDLMSPDLYNADRHPISATDIAMLATAYGYDVVPEPATLSVLALGGVALLRRRRVA